MRPNLEFLYPKLKWEEKFIKYSGFLESFRKNYNIKNLKIGAFKKLLQNNIINT